MEWFGGKPAGWEHIVDNGYQAVVRIDGKQISSYFVFSIYGSVENALQAAKDWRYALSTEHGLTKNMIRVIEPPNEDPYLEVKLQNGMIMKCDCDHIDLVENSIWTAWRGQGKKCWYVRRRDSVKRNQEYTMFHNLVCPDYTQVDHFNRDGLDNRTKNLREGEILNARNKGIQVNNLSGVTGVYFEPGTKASWKAQIGIGNKKKIKKSFSIAKYGPDTAKEMAIAQRKQWEQELAYGNEN